MTDFSPKDKLQGNRFSAYLFFTAALAGVLVMGLWAGALVAACLLFGPAILGEENAISL